MDHPGPSTVKSWMPQVIRVFQNLHIQRQFQRTGHDRYKVPVMGYTLVGMLKNCRCQQGLSVCTLIQIDALISSLSMVSSRLSTKVHIEAHPYKSKNDITRSFHWPLSGFGSSCNSFFDILVVHPDHPVAIVALGSDSEMCCDW